MATYYVSPSGLDANNGLGPDASAGTNKPWLTIGKALGAAGIASGDTVYLAPGTYREVVTVAMTSAVAETSVLGDPANAQGFKDGSGGLLGSGMVQWTAYTTNDKTAPSATTLLNLNGRDFLTFQNIMFVGGTANPATVTAATTTSTNITFKGCAFYDSRYLAGNTIRLDNGAGVAFNWLFDRCTFVGVPNPSSGGVLMLLQCQRTAADYDIGVTIRNCNMIGQKQISVQPTGAGVGLAGGLVVRNCDFLFGGGILTGANISTTIPAQVQNCFFYSGNTALSANTLGQIVEDYNLISALTARTNVTAGAHSISDGSYAPLFHVGQEFFWGGNIRILGEPMLSSPLLGFGNDGNQTTYDMRNYPRPAGGASSSAAAGALERGNTWAKETVTVRTGTNALSLTGPGYQDFDIPVDPVLTTVSCYLRYDTNYVGTKPQIQVLNGTEAGVADATSSAVTTVNTWEQLSLSFTPTLAGIVTVRLLSSDTSGAGKAFADDFLVA